MANPDKTRTLTPDEQAAFIAQLDDPESPISKAVASRAAFIAATQGPDSLLNRAARERLAPPTPQEQEASLLTISARVPTSIKRSIEASAALSGRTAAAEIRWRLELVDFSVRLLEEFDRQVTALDAAFASVTSVEELRKFYAVYRNTIEFMSFRYRPARRVSFPLSEER